MRQIVFLSDYGLKDPYVAHVKAVVKKLCPGAEVVDLTHMVDPFCVECAEYVLESSAHLYPPDSIFLAVVAPGVGSERKPLIVRGLSRWFVGPDNGLFTPVFERDATARAWVIRPSALPVEEISSTFHGRDIFAPAAALLSCGVSPDEIADEIGVEELVKKSLLWEERSGFSTCYKAIYIDNFGNVALSVKGVGPFSIGSRVRVSSPAGAFSARLVDTFSRVEVGELAVYVNSFGYLEIAVNRGDASKLLRVSVGDRVCLTPA